MENIHENFQRRANFETNSSDSNWFWIKHATTEKFDQRWRLFLPVHGASNSFIIPEIIALRRCIIRAYSILRIYAAWLSSETFHLLSYNLPRTRRSAINSINFTVAYYHGHMRSASKIYDHRGELITFTAFCQTRSRC